MRRTRGYSLYELLMTVVLAGIVLGIGVPSFGNLAASQRLRAQVDPLFHAVYLARKQSLTRREVIALCPVLPGSETCTNDTDWSAGWQMFVNLDRDEPAERDTNEIVLRRHYGDPRVRIVANRRSFAMRGTQRRTTNGTLIFCDRTNRVPGRALVISYTGRPRVAYRDRQGRNYRCPD